MVLFSTFMFNKKYLKEQINTGARLEITQQSKTKHEISNMIEGVMESLICIKHVKRNDYMNVVKGLVFGSVFIATMLPTDMLLVIFWYIRFQDSVVMNS